MVKPGLPSLRVGLKDIVASIIAAGRAWDYTEVVIRDHDTGQVLAARIGHVIGPGYRITNCNVWSRTRIVVAAVGLLDDVDGGASLAV